MGASPAGGQLRRPKLKTGLARLRRGPSTVQFGLDPDRAVLLTGIDGALSRALDRLDGSSRPAELAAALDVPPARVAALLELLAAADLLEDAAVTADGWGELALASRDRLAPDLSSLTLTHPGPDAGKAAFGRRLTAAVEIRGGGRVGATLAGLLSAAGIGRVRVVDDARTRSADLAPGGLTRADLDRRRGPAATRRASRNGPVPGRHGTALAGPALVGPAPVGPAPVGPAPVGPAPVGPALVGPALVGPALVGPALVGPAPAGTAPAGTDAPTLVVFADLPPAVGAGDELVRSGTPHLVAALRDTEGVVGPLVVPGRTSCLHCHHLTRTDRDRGWPHLAAQLAVPGPRTPAVRPCDVVLAVTVAGHAALQVLAFLDTGAASTIDGTLHLRLPGGAMRRRSWRRHPACGCSWANAAA